MITGSTRLKAGTAQKLVLNGFSTAVMVRLGRTWSNLMVDMVATNAKLRGRVIRILCEASGADEADVRAALERADGELKPALLSLLAGVAAAAARTALEQHRRVRRAGAALPPGPPRPLPRPGPSGPGPAPPGPARPGPAPPAPSRHGPPRTGDSPMIGTTRRHLTALTVATAVVALAACAPSSSSTSGGGSGGSDGKGVTLSVWSWRTEDVAAYDAIFDVYEKAHPGVKVDFKAFKNTEYNQILTTGLAGSNGPDVVQVRSYGQLQPTIASGSLVPLDSTVDLSSWDANVVKSAEGKEDGKLYAVPLAQQTLQMFYNKDLFAKQGLTPPTTWAQFVEVNARLKEQGITPMAVGAKDSWTLPIVHQVLAAPRFGGAAFEKAVLSGQKTFTDPDWVASVDELKALKPYLPDSAVGVAYTDAQILFTSGKAAMFPGGSFELGFFQKQNPALKMGVFQVPAPDGLARPRRRRRPATPTARSASRPGATPSRRARTWWPGWRPRSSASSSRTRSSSCPRSPVSRYTDPLLKQMADSYAKNPSPYLLLVDFRYGTPSGTDVLGTGLQELLLGKKDAAAVSERPADRRLPVVQALGVALDVTT